MGVSYNYTITANMSVDQKEYVFSITKEGTQINDWTTEEEEILKPNPPPLIQVLRPKIRIGHVEEEDITAAEKK